MIGTIEQIIHSEIDLQGPGVAIAVVNDGQPVHLAGYGMANLEWNCPIRPDTVFRLASISKQFTATAIMLLEQEGKLRLDDPITTYFPDYPTHGHTITITHLLNHTSGIKSYTSLANFARDIAKKDLAPGDLLPYFKDLPLDFEPGTRFLYNNSGYHLLGLLLEKITSASYAQYIQQRIFQPLGMNHSYYMSDDTVIPRRASGYNKVDQGYRHAEYLNMMIPYAAGSLGSTVEDLVRWDTSLREERLLAKAIQERMYAPTLLADAQTENYGFGWGVANYGGHRVVHHGGGIPGFHTFIARFIDDTMMIAVLANNPEIPVEKIVRATARLLLAIPPQTRTPLSLAVATLDKTVGTYDLEGGPSVDVVREKRILTLRGGITGDLLPINETTYYDRDDDEIEVHFSDEQNGAFQTLTLHMPFYQPFKAHRKLSIHP